VLAAPVAVDIVISGVHDLRSRPGSKHNLDDRAAMRYLMQMRGPGDVVITSRLGLPAIWWYGGVSVASPNLGRQFAQDGSPILRVGFRSGEDCRAGEVPPMPEARRALVYLAFDANNPPGLRELTLDTLSKHGRIMALRAVAEEGIVAAFEPDGAPIPWPSLVTAGFGGPLQPAIARPAGCLGFFQEPRW
jgi:hypothetical protein